MKQKTTERPIFKKPSKSVLEWVRQGAKVVNLKSKSRLARFRRNESQESKIVSETNELYIPPGPRLG